MADSNNSGKGWRKYFKVADTSGQLSPISGKNQFGLPGYAKNDNNAALQADFVFRNYASRLPEVYSGHPNRIERYNQYESMDMDSEVNACLDIIAEFSTQLNEQNGTPFEVKYNDKPTDHEIEIIKKQMQQWVKINKLDQRIFKLFRNTIKYGDQIFVRDPETFEMMWVDTCKLARVIVNESEGKRPEQYVIRDINPNFQNLSVAAKTTTDYLTNPVTGSVAGAAGYNPAGGGSGNGAAGSRFMQAMNEVCLDAKHVVHISLNEGLDAFWPFGRSILEQIYMVFKQKQLLEDSILIYRVQRAPERRIFKIDVGNMPSHLAMAFVERVKNEMHQRRLPTVTGGGQNMMDASYNPLSVGEDYFFPTTSDGRGSSVDTLPGGCLSMDTRVPLLDGRTLSLAELTAEYKSGKENWTYSADPTTGKAVPGLISWAGITHKNASVLEIVLDNGKKIICTPDHKFPIMRKGKIRADELLIGESLIPHNTRNQNISKFKKLGYTQIYQNDTKKWEFAHRSIVTDMKKFNNSYITDLVFNDKNNNRTKDTIHHKDHNRYNNNPSNLVMMNFMDHKEYHAHHGFSKEAQMLGTKAANAAFEELKKDPIKWNEYLNRKSLISKNSWEALSDFEKNVIIYKRQIGLHEYFNNLSNEKRTLLCERNAKKSKLGTAALNNLLENDVDFRNKFSISIRDGWEQFKKTDEFNIRSAKISKNNSLRMNDPEYKETVFKNQRVKFDKHLLDNIQSMVVGKSTHDVTINHVCNMFNQNQMLLTHFLTINKDTCCANWKNDKITPTQISSMVKKFGYSNWKHFRKEANLYNHKIVSIKLLPDQIEVGTLTIDVDEVYHNFHNFALEVGVYTQNSNLGEIDDLKYFNNKMSRGLRVPSSYLPTGPDDSDRVTSDGKVGTALIQEYRFNQYCERLQSLVVEKLDDEFKMFLKWRGFNIDSGLFSLKFNEPQNFASYRQSELDNARITSFTSLEQLPYMSKRFMLGRFLGLTEEEIKENEEMWREERDDPAIQSVSGQDLRGVGITPGGMETDIATGEEIGGMGPMEPGIPDAAGAPMPPAPAGAAPPA